MVPLEGFERKSGLVVVGEMRKNMKNGNFNPQAYLLNALSRQRLTHQGHVSVVGLIVSERLAMLRKFRTSSGRMRLVLQLFRTERSLLLRILLGLGQGIVERTGLNNQQIEYPPIGVILLHSLFISMAPPILNPNP